MEKALIGQPAIPEANAVAGGFPGGFYSTESNPDSRMVSMGGICEDAMSGILAGLVVITPAAGVVLPGFIIVGLCAALAGIARGSYMSLGDPLSGDGMELNCIIAVLLGGTSFYGGEGSVIKTVIGALILAGAIDSSGICMFTNVMFPPDSWRICSMPPVRVTGRSSECRKLASASGTWSASSIFLLEFRARKTRCQRVC